MIRLHKPKTGLQQNRSLTNNAKMVQKIRTVDSRKTLVGNAFIKYGSRLTFCHYSGLHDLDFTIFRSGHW